MAEKTVAYSWDKRMEVVARYMLLGNMRAVSEQTGVAYQTLMDWKSSDWWPDLVQQLKRQKSQKQTDNIISLIDQSLEVMKDRLDNGDFVFDQKTGQVVRKPVSVRDATAIATALLQRQTAIEQMEQKYAQEQLSVKETLVQLANEFKKYNKIASSNVSDAVIIEDKHALHDQRKEGLQEGSGEIHQPA
jgi:hypothetical protein